MHCSDPLTHSNRGKQYRDCSSSFMVQSSTGSSRMAALWCVSYLSVPWKPLWFLSSQRLALCPAWLRLVFLTSNPLRASTCPYRSPPPGSRPAPASCWRLPLWPRWRRWTYLRWGQTEMGGVTVAHALFPSSGGLDGKGKYFLDKSSFILHKVYFSPPVV